MIPSVSRIFLPAVLVAGLLAPGQQFAGHPESSYSVFYVHLSVPPAVQSYKEGGVRSARLQSGLIQSQQDVVSTELRRMGAREVGRLHRLVNVMRVFCPADAIGSVATIPGVIRVTPARRFKPMLTTSVPFIGAPTAWSSPSGVLTGAGIRIGIIDTGIDYFHATFGGVDGAARYTADNRAILEPGSFPTPVVAGGYDFAGDSYDADNPAYSTPVPDPDPLDCWGHGTHVAGIAAGRGVTSGGATFSGSYSNVTYSQFALGPGVAPGATLFGLKVFGCSGSSYLVLEALDWALDPNGDEDYADRLDVVNLSLGSSYGFGGPGDPELEALNHLADLGCVPVVAAGNSGNAFYVISTPAVADKAIAVANSVDAGLNSDAIQVQAPMAIGGLYAAVQGEFTVPLWQSGEIIAPVIQALPADACSPLTNAAAIQGKIALLDRGNCLFTDKVLQAQNAGALAVIVANNVAGDPIAMGGTPGYTPAIPGVMISRAHGDLLKSNLAAGVIVRLSPSLGTSRADQLSSSSSRGPAAPGSVLKPEVAAPGSSIVSARHGSGTGNITLSGTSMATPHVAGAAALLKQKYPARTATDIKATLLNTAKPLRDGAGMLYSLSRAGAGRVRVDRAIDTPISAQAQASNGLVALNLGALNLSAPTNFTRWIAVTNHSQGEIVCQITVSNVITEPGFALQPMVSTVDISAQSEALIGLSFTIDPSLFDRSPDSTTPLTLSGLPRNSLYEVAGQIWLTYSTNSIQVPYYGCVRAGTDSQAIPATVLLTNPATPIELTLPGSQANTQAVTSVFQLGTIHPLSTSQDQAIQTADIVAVGAASDAATRLSLSNSILYFGLAAARPWTTLSPLMVQFAIEIDLNLDDVPDYNVYNDCPTISGYPDGNDVLMSFLGTGTGNGPSNGWLNVFPPSIRDTALLNNRVLVIPVLAGNLGLTATNSQFRYRACSWGPSQRSGPAVDVTGWVSFDAAHPMMDSTPYGLNGTPFFATGTPVRINHYSTPPGIAPGSLLLLHHFNPPETQVQIIPIQSATEPVLLSIALDAQGRPVLNWASSPGITYIVEETSSLAIAFSPLATVEATLHTSSFTDNTVLSGSRFYRIRVE